MKKVLLFLIITIYSLPFMGQIKVNRVNDYDLLKKQLVGEGLEISNFKVKGGTNAIGTFNDPLQILGVKTGIILATGDIEAARGPNNDGGLSSISNQQVKDELLDVLSNDLGVSYNDAIVLEFDFVPKGNIFSINYVFASDEYTEHDVQYPDFFGVWITGPGYPNPTNLALVPGTNTPVNTSTINDKINSKYYNDNGSGSTPLFNQLLGYDGYTDLLKAELDVIPCQTYHVKLAIADAKDYSKDSGVFVETKSLKSDLKPVLKLEYESSKNTMYEGCANATLSVNLENKTKVPLYFDLKYSGTADSTDFESLPKSIVIPVGQKSTQIEYKAKIDAKEGMEKFSIKLVSRCDTSFEIDAIDLLINDEYKKEVPDVTFCNADTFQLDAFDVLTDEVQFQYSNKLSCLNCVNPFVYVVDNELIKYNLIDKETNCKYVDSFEIKRFIPFLKYSLDTSVYYTVLDLIGKIDSSNLDRFDWNINQKKYIGNQVLHSEINSVDRKACFDIELTAYQDSLKCEVKRDSSICWDAYMEVPNIITPNNDGKNDFFVPLGISSGFWSFTVYNRYGKKVYEDKNYKLDFSGVGLSEGTYFYYLENKFKDRFFKGWLQIVR